MIWRIEAERRRKVRRWGRGKRKTGEIISEIDRKQNPVAKGAQR